MAERSQYTNRLIHEKSPYLLQHAHNPVDWFPWGEEAFQAARSSDRPIFLSIGYATCHWCHTMESESFENTEVAKLLNETFINIKVDREELPEVDNLYMEFAQSMMAGAAGWPLNVILTPQLQPFFAATYLPPHTTEGMMGIMDLIRRIKEVWTGEERERVTAQAKKIVEVFEDSIHLRGDRVPGKEYIESAVNLLFTMADPVYGGMKGAPKFPIGYQPNFLMHYSYTTNDSRSLFMVERTLDMMQRGGIYDHIGGGFSRYSVDEEWLVPHFEKMLYDNALLANAYLEAWKLTKRDLYREVCEQMIQYVRRDMTDPQGGFYSAEDADSEGVEGKFYMWTVAEIQQILGDQSQRFCDFYGVTHEGNFEGRNILHIEKRIEEYAMDRSLDPLELETELTEMNHRLWTARTERVHPLKDDKVLCSWNGLMIYTIVEAGCAFGAKPYLEAGVKAANFLRENLWKDGQLLRRWREGEANFNAGLNEYAFMIRALLTLFEAGCGNQWLHWAMQMEEILRKSFKAEGGGFYQTDGTDPHFIIRQCHFSDGAEPSGNAVHCENLLRFYLLTHNPAYLQEAEDILKAVKKYLDAYSPGYSYHLRNLIRYYQKGAPTIVIALNALEENQVEIHLHLFQSFLPHRAIIWRKEGDEELSTLLPFVKGYPCINGNTTVYICHDQICEKPLTDIHEIKDAIDKL